MSEELSIVIAPDGQVKFIWHDGLASLCDEGQTHIRRVGEVEPTADGQWFADLTRIGGGRYGPYSLRQLALDHEQAVVRGALLGGAL